ncbi:conserved hypothetical protein [Flavobacterium sp. 9AF]|uniref:YgaP family membrane protein n=1 Tax=Flavobacterium sp. 9AF TaxID=2653142 RepID=UPI0012F078CE|nr:DUF2892 domain-containing protein [Flavobacterium sp. 9AF]VXC21408.1 conserved hypothetical protein [Flavobacterium sp. 9AF]
MKKNMGKGDRFLRVIIGIVAFVFGLSDLVEGTWKWVALAVGIIMILTSLIQFCPLYTLLGINTCKVKSEK